MVSPAAQLEGLTVGTGWKVLRRIDLESVTTGGCFSEAYVVKHTDGRDAFLKALDYSQAFLVPNTAQALQGLLDSFAFEREITGICQQRRMTRVVLALESGQVTIPGGIPPVVEFIVFELGKYDVRGKFSAGPASLAWRLRSLHHVATGMFQLHQAGIAHQDLKPSNVVVFERDSSSKVADLGRASVRGRAGPTDGAPVAGDCTYAPPEFLYGYLDPDWVVKRIACDIYLLGSLVFSYFAKTPMTAAILSKMDPQHHWRLWSGSFGDAIPLLEDGFAKVMTELPPFVDELVRGDVVRVIRELCAPDPKLRGRPGSRVVDSGILALQRYVSILDRLATLAEREA